MCTHQCCMPHGIAGVSVPRETGEVKGVVPRPWPSFRRLLYGVGNFSLYILSYVVAEYKFCGLLWYEGTRILTIAQHAANVGAGDIYKRNVDY